MTKLPDKMAAVVISAFGGPEKLEVKELPLPDVQPHEVLIKVAAAGINRPDIFQRQGLYPAPDDASDILGLEVSGEIVVCGALVNRWKVGDYVCALLNGGGYAAFVNVPATQCLPIPKGISLLEAAAIPETLYTVWFNVFQKAQLQAGEAFLVHGGASGIGTMAIQLAVAMGARVFATVSDDKKGEFCLQLGAEKVIDYHQEDFVEVLKAQTEGRGVDVILDMVGGEIIARNIKLAAQDGRIVMIAFLQGSTAKVDFMRLMLKRLTLTGSTLRAQSTDEKAQLTNQIEKHVWPLLSLGTIKPCIYRVYSLDQIAQAHRLMESRRHIGKLVLQLDS